MAVTYDFRILNVSDSVEQLKKIAFGCVERQVANVQTRRTDFNPFRFACRSRRMHRPQRANHPESIQTRHSATPLETPPPRAGIGPVLNRQPAQSNNEAARAQKVAPW